MTQTETATSLAPASSAVRAFPRYPAYRDSGVPWLGQIPAHWEIRRLGDCAAIINGYPFDSEMFSNSEGIPLIRIRDLLAGHTETFYTGLEVPEAIVADGDVLVGMDGDFNVCWWNGGRSLLNQRLCCLRPRPLLDRRFMYYWLGLPLKIINDLTWFTTVKHLSSVEVSRIRFPLPPLAEQRVIAAFLDRETARLDALVVAKQRLIGLLREKRAALISRAVTRGLDPQAPMKDSGIEWIGEIPEHWDMKRCKSLFEEVDDRTETGTETLLSLRMNVGLIPHNEVSDTPISSEQLIGYKRTKPGELVMNRMRAASGLFAVTETLGIVSPDYAVFVPLGTYVLTTLHFCSRHQQCRAFFALIRRG